MNIFERLVITSTTKYLECKHIHENYFIDPFSSITHDTQKLFNNPFEVKTVFRDISGGFDKVWHVGLIIKIKRKSICGNILNTVRYFLNAHEQ